MQWIAPVIKLDLSKKLNTFLFKSLLKSTNEIVQWIAPMIKSDLSKKKWEYIFLKFVAKHLWNCAIKTKNIVAFTFVIYLGLDLQQKIYLVFWHSSKALDTLSFQFQFQFQFAALGYFHCLIYKWMKSATSILGKDLSHCNALGVHFN